jgi:hypothetical protein
MWRCSLQIRISKGVGALSPLHYNDARRPSAQYVNTTGIFTNSRKAGSDKTVSDGTVSGEAASGETVSDEPPALIGCPTSARLSQMWECVRRPLIAIC